MKNTLALFLGVIFALAAHAWCQDNLSSIQRCAISKADSSRLAYALCVLRSAYNHDAVVDRLRKEYSTPVYLLEFFGTGYIFYQNNAIMEGGKGLVLSATNVKPGGRIHWRKRRTDLSRILTVVRNGKDNYSWKDPTLLLLTEIGREGEVFTLRYGISDEFAEELSKASK